MQTSTAHKRGISWVQGTAMTVGAVLGSGILALPALAANLAGPASILGWVLMGIFSLPMVAVLGALASRYPDAGGIATYARRAFGPMTARLAGWFLLSPIPTAMPLTVLVGASFLAAPFGWPKEATYLVAACMLLFAAGCNYRGIELSGKVQVAVVGIVFSVLLTAVVAAAPHADPEAFLPFAPHGWMPVGEAMLLMFFAFIGWEMIGHLAEEFRNPRRDIPLSLGLGAAIVNILYVSVAVVTVGTKSYLGERGLTAMTHMVAQGWGAGAGSIVAALGFVVCYGAMHTFQAGLSRLVFAQAREGDFPRALAVLHPRLHTPHRALACFLLVCIPVLFCSYQWDWHLDTLVEIPSVFFLAAYMIAMASAVRLLPKGSWCRRLAGLSLILCGSVYLFSGWFGTLPFFVAALGWLIRRSTSKSIRCEADMPQA